MFLAFTGVRYVVWYGLVVMPVVGRAAAEIFKDRPWMRPGRKNLVNVAILALLAAPVVLYQPPFISSMPLPDAYWKYVLRHSELGPLVSADTPVGAAEYLRQNPGGKLFNEMGYGSYLIWAIPEQKVFIDPRVELYPMEQWLDYKDIGAGVRSLELLDQYGVERILLSIKDQGELIKVLENDPAWAMHFQDQWSQVWEKE
jgi:hypothetical protein